MKDGISLCRCGHIRDYHAEKSKSVNFTQGKCSKCSECDNFMIPSLNNPIRIKNTRRGQLGKEDKIRLALLEKSGGPFLKPYSDTTEWLISTVRKLAGIE